MKGGNLYDRKVISVSEAIDKIDADDSILVGMAASEPQGLLNKLGSRKDEFKNVKVISCLMLGDYGLRESEDKGNVLNESWFYGPYERNNREGNVTYLPNNLHSAGSSKLSYEDVDIAWVTGSPIDDKGYFTLSCLVYEREMIENADMVVLESNRKHPRTYGNSAFHISDVDYVVENDQALVSLPPAEPGETEERIGEHIAGIVDDGSTIQLGIGRIPNAVANSLMSKEDLGIHTEMFTENMVDLYNEGVVTGEKKTKWKGRMVGAFALGTEKLYDFVDNNPVVEFREGSVTNDPCVIGQNYKMVSINTALQVDLTGQVVSESIGPKQYSGTGGQVDTHRGAQRSDEGTGVIALPSTAKNGEISTIRTFLPEGARITIGNNDIDTVVTEYGVAHLKGKSVRDRAKALIDISHPDFRDQLREEAKQVNVL